MDLSNLQYATNSVKRIKRVGRGPGSKMGKTATRGQTGQKSRSGYKIKRGFEGGQQPLQKRLPKIGFTSRVRKPFVINVEKCPKILTLDKLTLEGLVDAGLIKASVKKVKLIGKSAASLKAKIQCKDIKTTGK